MRVVKNTFGPLSTGHQKSRISPSSRQRHSTGKYFHAEIQLKMQRYANDQLNLPPDWPDRGRHERPTKAYDVPRIVSRSVAPTRWWDLWTWGLKWDLWWDLGAKIGLMVELADLGGTCRFGWDLWTWVGLGDAGGPVFH